MSGRRAEVASSRDIDCSEGGSDVSVVSPAPRGLGVLCSDGYNQCSDAKGWVLDAGAHLWLLCSRAFVLLSSRAGDDGAWTCETSTNWHRQLSRAE